MIAHGDQPYLECSSRGDARFSAFYAKPPGRGGRSIEELYQAFKVFQDGSGLDWWRAKGKRAVNQAEAAKFYSQLWDEYIVAYPHLLQVLREAPGLCDRFGKKGRCCQATELWRIRNSPDF